MKPIDRVEEHQRRGKYCPKLQHRNLFELILNIAACRYRCGIDTEDTEADDPCFISDWSKCRFNIGSFAKK